MVEMTFRRNKDGSISLRPTGKTAKALAPVMPGGHLRNQLFLDEPVLDEPKKEQWRLIKKEDVDKRNCGGNDENLVTLRR